MKRISILANQVKKNKTSIKLDSPEFDDEMEKNQGPGAFNFGTSKKEESKRIKEFKSKVGQLEREVRDIGHENYLDKECLLEDIRELSKENKFFENVLGMLLQNTELEDIRMASSYNE